MEATGAVKRGRKKRKTLSAEDDMQIRESIVITLSYCKTWARPVLMRAVCDDLGIPVHGGFQTKVRQILDQLVLFYHLSILQERAAAAAASSS